MDKKLNMHKSQKKTRLYLYATFTLLAFVILVDFVLPGRIINDEIIKVQKNRQQNYNTARNYHYSYKVVTNEHEFLVAADFVALEMENKNIKYTVSPIFKEVNWYRLLSSENKSFYSLRIASGLVLPLVSIILIFIAFRYYKKIDYLILIIRILLIADLILLIT